VTETIHIKSEEPEEVKDAKLAQVFDPAFKLTHLSVTARDIPCAGDHLPEQLGRAIVYTYMEMKENNSAVTVRAIRGLRGIEDFNMAFVGWTKDHEFTGFKTRLKRLLVRLNLIDEFEPVW
jgi:hypothetical protein